MLRVPAILLVVALTLLGSGAARYGHERVHAAEDAVAATASIAHHGCEPGPGDVPRPAHPPRHDASNCLTHAQLAMPLAADGAPPVLLSLGLSTAVPSVIAPRPVHARVPARIDCRGPPVC